MEMYIILGSNSLIAIDNIAHEAYVEELKNIDETLGYLNFGGLETKVLLSSDNHFLMNSENRVYC